MARSVVPGYFGLAAIMLGSIAAAVNMAWWFVAQVPISYQVQYESRMVAEFMVIQCVSAALIGLGLIRVYWRGSARSEPEPDRSPLGLVGDVVSSKTAKKVAILGGLAYAAFYLVASSIVVYQPTVDFSAAYGVTAPTWNIAACCGSYGSIPMVILYVLPQLHLGMQIIPLDIILALVIPILVGINAAVAYSAMRNRPTGAGLGWFGALGASVGLFTSCPTCAGLFLASSLGGLGATSLAISLAPFQAAFIVVALPVLAITPVLTAGSVRRTIQSGCKPRE